MAEVFEVMSSEFCPHRNYAVLSEINLYFRVATPYEFNIGVATGAMMCFRNFCYHVHVVALHFT